MAEVITEKELKKFKITLLLLPIIPCAILWYKHHYTVASYFAGICWAILIMLLAANLFGKNIDKPVYLLIKKILSFLGTILSSIALVFVWICTIFPTGIIAKLVKRDRLSLNKHNVESYWKDVEEKEPTYENQY